MIADPDWRTHAGRTDCRILKENNMEYLNKKLLKMLKQNKLNCEQVLIKLSEHGGCPALLNDDNGHWAVSFEGFQNVAIEGYPTDITTTFFIKANDWKDTIREALIWALEKD